MAAVPQGPVRNMDIARQWRLLMLQVVVGSGVRGQGVGGQGSGVRGQGRCLMCFSRAVLQTLQELNVQIVIIV